LTHLDLEAANGRPAGEPRREDTADLLSRKGEEHEADLLRALRDEGEIVVEIDTSIALAESVADTLEAMHAGEPFIHQAALRNARWRGYADFLERVDTRSDLGS